jgi:hypothetical protein
MCALVPLSQYRFTDFGTHRTSRFPSGWAVFAGVIGCGTGPGSIAAKAGRDRRRRRGEGRRDEKKGILAVYGLVYGLLWVGTARLLTRLVA